MDWGMFFRSRESLKEKTSGEKKNKTKLQLGGFADRNPKGVLQLQTATRETTQLRERGSVYKE